MSSFSKLSMLSVSAVFILYYCLFSSRFQLPCRRWRFWILMALMSWWAVLHICTCHMNMASYHWSRACAMHRCTMHHELNKQANIIKLSSYHITIELIRSAHHRSPWHVIQSIPTIPQPTDETPQLQPLQHAAYLIKLIILQFCIYTHIDTYTYNIQHNVIVICDEWWWI